MTNSPTDSNAITVGADGESLPILDILTGRGFITGKSGAGKSNSASVVVEELLEAGHPVLIVDTDGEYYGLKERYEVLHVGADEECDLQVGPEHAEKLAELALEQSVPIILDVSGYLDQEEANAIVRETARHLFTREKKLNAPFLLVVEEVHEFLPETTGLDETGEMLIRVAKRGRKRGLGMLGISQRPADVKKDFITQCDWLVWHRLTWENDLKVVRTVLGKDYADAIQDLADGESFIQSDFLEEAAQRVQWRRKRTFDAGATPTLEDTERPDLKSVSADLVGELASISEREERRQDRIAQLEDTIETKEKRIDELEAELENARDLSNMAEQFADAMLQSGGSAGAEGKVKDLVEERNELENRLADREATIEALQSRVDELEAFEVEAERLEGLNLDEAEEAITRLREALDIDVDGEAEKWKQKYREEKERREESDRAPPERTDILDHPAVQRQLNQLKEPIRKLDEKQLKMLEWWRYYGPGSLADAYFYAGGSRSSGAQSTKSKPLRNIGLVQKEQQGEYRYAVPDLVRDRFGSNPQIDDDDLEALTAALESLIDDRLEEATE